MRRIFALLIILLSAIFSLTYGQESRVKATRVIPLYCYPNVRHHYDSSCVDRVRITFQNYDDIRVHSIKFDLKIRGEGEDTSIFYKARHEISIFMNPDEVYTADIVLLNPISPPEGEHSFKNRKSWSWEVDIVSLNQ